MQLQYFAAVLIASVPFWLLGASTGWTLLPGLPASAFMFIAPATAATYMVLRSQGARGASTWLCSHFSPPFGNLAFFGLLALLAPALLLFFAYLLSQLTSAPAPAQQITAETFLRFLTLFSLFAIPALMEELGWTGYALPRLRQRLSTLAASVFLGVVWSIWHWIPLVQIGRDLTWIASWSAATVAMRLLICVTALNSRMPVLVATTFHASANAAWQMYPVNASHYDPLVHSLVLGVSCLLVLLFFGPQLQVRRSSEQ